MSDQEMEQVKSQKREIIITGLIYGVFVIAFYITLIITVNSNVIILNLFTSLFGIGCLLSALIVWTFHMNSEHIDASECFLFLVLFVSAGFGMLSASLELIPATFY